MSCAEDLSGLKTGDLSSPSWPAPYAENANCQYTLSVEDHLQLELHFSEHFDVEQRPDGQCIDALRVGVDQNIHTGLWSRPARFGKCHDMTFIVHWCYTNKDLLID